MTLTDEQRQAILDEIVAISTPRQRRDFEITRLEDQHETGLTLEQAKGALDRKVRVGQLQHEKALVDGHWTWVYWRLEDEPQATRE